MGRNGSGDCIVSEAEDGVAGGRVGEPSPTEDPVVSIGISSVRGQGEEKQTWTKMKRMRPNTIEKVRLGTTDMEVCT